MKNILTIYFVLLLSINIFSQTDTISKKRYFFPLEVGLHLNNTNETGYGVSIISNIFTKNNRAILFGVKYAKYNFHYNHLNTAAITIDNKTYYDIIENISALEIPLYYRYMHKSNVFLNIGLSYGLNFKSKFNSKYYKSVSGTFYEETKSTSYNITHYGNLIGGIGFQKLYKKYGFNISLNFMFNSLSLNLNNQDFYYGDIPNLSNISFSVAFLIR